MAVHISLDNVRYV